MLGFYLSFWYFVLRLVCFVLYLFVFENRLISNFISVFFLFWGYNFRRAYTFGACILISYVHVSLFFINKCLEVCVCIASGPWRERGLKSCLHLIYLSLHCSSLGWCTQPLESRLPDAGTTYENVCNVIEYSSNKYFASCWYVL